MCDKSGANFSVRLRHGEGSCILLWVNNNSLKETYSSGRW